jgi:hypothetical protein
VHNLSLTGSAGLGALACGVFAGASAADAAGSIAAEEALVQRIEARVSQSTEDLVSRGSVASGANVIGYRRLVREETWVEKWPDGAGAVRAETITAGIWNAAIEAALADHNAAYLPARPEPYYLDGPIVLKSGQRLVAARDAEIRLRPGVNTCMVRNANPLPGENGPLPADRVPDTNIVIEGGIWTTLATAPGETNGNPGARADEADSIFGAYGVILLDNVRGFVIRDLAIARSKAFGIHIGACSDFLIEAISFDEHRRDGVHVSGETEYGVIRGIHGRTGDDLVALNAWDWLRSTVAYGPIRNIVVDDARGGELRLLPGVKRFANGVLQPCPLENIVIRNVHVSTVKFYDQPDLEHGVDKNRSEAIGEARNVILSGIETRARRGGTIQCHANVNGFHIRDVVLLEAPSDGDSLVLIGPRSATYTFNQDDPARWVELFSPDRDCTVRGFSLSKVSVREHGELRALGPEAVDALVAVVAQKRNSDYPRTAPRGGTGSGRVIREDGSVIEGHYEGRFNEPPKPVRGIIWD